MPKKLTEEQVDELFKFCHQHHVYEYDLQTELVDHLASSIENQWETEPGLPFEEALARCYKKFGFYGFSKIKTQKKKELYRKYNVLLWKYFLDYYKWPKVLMTLAFTLGFYSLLVISKNMMLVLIICLALFTAFVFFYYYKIFPKYFKLESKNGKSFLLLQKLKQIQNSSVFILQLPIFVLQISHLFEFNLIENNWVLFSLAFFIVSLSIVLYGNFFMVPQRVKGHFIELYGEFIV